MKKQNWDAIEERQDGAGWDNPIPGGYIGVICHVEDNDDKEYLLIEWDFADGDYAGFNEETYDRAGFWPTLLRKSYKPKALPFFKGFKTALEQSNRGYRFDELNLDRMVGKYIGLVLGEEEYQKNNGTIGTRLYVAQTRNIQSIRNGDFKVPDLKVLKNKPAAGLAPAPKTAAAPSFADLTDDDGELPF